MADERGRARLDGGDCSASTDEGSDSMGEMIKACGCALRSGGLRVTLLFAAVLVLGVGVAGATPFGQITEFSSGFCPGAIVNSLTPGPDGNLWFTDSGTKAIGQITTAGVVSEYSSGFPAGSVPSVSGGGVTYGSDGNIWFADSGTKAIGVFDPGIHAVSEFKTGLNPGSSPYSVVAGSDGNV
jgi:streptogramin lyase